MHLGSSSHKAPYSAGFPLFASTFSLSIRKLSRYFLQFSGVRINLMDQLNLNHQSKPEPSFELQSMAIMKNYQRWLICIAWPFLGKRILEVGSGIGNMSQHLPIREKLVLTEVDQALFESLQNKFLQNTNKNISLKRITDAETLQSVIVSESIDTIVSFNVLEHIDDDMSFLKSLIKGLSISPSENIKRIVSIVPAHSWAYGSVDKEFGHYRRYTNSSFEQLLIRATEGSFNGKNYYSSYLNAVGLAGWWINGCVFKRKRLGVIGLKAFDLLCPLFVPIDCFFHRGLRFPYGNSLFTVYQVDDDQ